MRAPCRWKNDKRWCLVPSDHTNETARAAESDVVHRRHRRRRRRRHRRRRRRVAGNIFL